MAKLATAAAPATACSSILQRTSNQAPKRKQHSGSSTLQLHPCSCTSNQAPKRNQHSDSSTLQRHPAAAPCNGTSNPTQLQNAKYAPTRWYALTAPKWVPTQVCTLKMLQWYVHTPCGIWSCTDVCVPSMQPHLTMDPYGLRNSGDIRWPRGVGSETGMWNKMFASI